MNVRKTLLVTLLSTSLGTLCSAQGLLFGESRPFPTEQSGTIAVGEFDGYPGPDVILNHVRENDALFFSNLGGGAFEAAIMTTPIPDFAMQVIGDVDNDGDDDILRANPGSAPILSTSDGTGGFHSSSSAFPSGVEFRGDLELADIDGDGWLDLAVGSMVVSGTTPRVGILRGGPAGTLANQPFPYAIDTNALALFDGDGDGDVDLYVGANLTYGSDRYFTNVGGMTFVDSTNLIPNLAVPKRSVRSLDVDGDGDQDLVVSEVGLNGTMAFHVLVNAGGRFSLLVGAIAYMPRTVTEFVPGDVDLDGDLDLVLDEQTFDFGVLENDGRGRFTNVRHAVPHRGAFLPELFLIDIDGDRDLDVIRPQLSHVELMRNDGTGHWNVVSTRTTPEFLMPTYGYHIVDLDGDSDPDVLTASITGPVPHVNDGRGNLTSLSLLPSNPSCFALASADVDRDGDIDLVLGGGFDPISGTLASDELWLQTPAGFRRSPTFPVDTAGTGSVLLEDFLGNGWPDFIGTDGGGALRFYRNGSGALFLSEPHRVAAAPRGLVHAVAGDVDGDLDLDLVVSDGTTDTLLRNVGGVFQVDATFQPPARVGSRMELVDLDGDGDLDLLLPNANCQGLSEEVLLWNDGLGTFTPATRGAPSTPFATIDLETGDFDGDGDVDVVFFDSPSIYSPRGLKYFENTGTGFQERVGVFPYADGLFQEVLQAVDLDRDGDLDLLLGSDRMENHIYWNLTRQLDPANDPSIAKPWTVRVHGSPAELYGLCASPWPANTLLPGLGVLGLDLRATTLITRGALDATGMGRVTLPIPSSPTLLGQTAYTQAFLANGSSLTLTNTLAIQISNL